MRVLRFARFTRFFDFGEVTRGRGRGRLIEGIAIIMTLSLNYKGAGGSRCRDG